LTPVKRVGSKNKVCWRSKKILIPLFVLGGIEAAFLYRSRDLLVALRVQHGTGAKQKRDQTSYLQIK